MGCTGSKPATSSSVDQGEGTRDNPSMHAVRFTPEERAKAIAEMERLRRERQKEKEIEKKLYEQRDILREQALPMIEKRPSHDNLAAVSQDPEESAALLIQKQARRKAAKLRAEAEQRWMVFSNLDTISESDVVHLAKFMETAVTKVPTLKSVVSKSMDELAQPLEDLSPPSVLPAPVSSVVSSSVPPKPPMWTEEHDDGRIHVVRENSKDFLTAIRSIGADKLPPDSLINLKRELSMASGLANSRKSDGTGEPSVDPERIFRVDRIACEDSRDNLIESSLKRFDLPRGPVTPEIAHQVVEAYKSGGKLSTESVHKLLRLAYRSLKELPNTTRLSLDPEDRLAVVGDIHGQLADLFYILDHFGLPETHKKYIFNGDFVDRGPKGVECMIVLLTLYVAFPGRVSLNRGNHEDFAICCAYGFQAECSEKYDDITFGMFVEVFHYLPLFAIVNEAIFVLHGGLFHCQDVTLEELDSIQRFDFSLKDLPEGGETLEVFSRQKRVEWLKQMQRDALWSDPMGESGVAQNPRGAGVAFGADVARNFLNSNNLKMVVRSHECVRTGFDRPFTGDDANLLCTVFSASNYGGGGNSAAYMIFSSKPLFNMYGSSPTAVEDTSLMYTVFYFETELFDDDETKTVVEHGFTNGLTMYDMILGHKSQLMSAFRNKDVHNTGKVSRVHWAEVMQNVLKLHILWLTMVPVLVQEDCISTLPNSNIVVIDYEKFLQGFSAAILFEVDAEGEGGESPNRPSRKHVEAARQFTVQGNSNSDDKTISHSQGVRISGAVVESLYAHHQLLETVFRFFDGDCNGTISLDEFKAGCELLNESLPPEEKVTDFERLLAIMDVGQRGEVDINEFFEMFRLSDSHTNITARLLKTPSNGSAAPSLPPLATDEQLASPRDGHSPRLKSERTLAADLFMKTRTLDSLDLSHSTNGNSSPRHSTTTATSAPASPTPPPSSSDPSNNIVKGTTILIDKPKEASVPSSAPARKMLDI